MTNQISAWLSAIGLGGVLLFAAAYYIHQKVRLTRTACVIAAAAGFLTYAAVIGTWVNNFAVQIRYLLVAAMAIGVCVIIADIKGKRKGADRPALFAFFLVPLFLAAFLSALPSVLGDVGVGVQKVGDNVNTQMGP